MRRIGVAPRGAFILVIGIVLVTAVPSSTFAQIGPPDLAVPTRLGSVHTIVATTVPDGSVRVDALYADLQTEVESRLRRAGIPVESSSTARLVLFVDIFGEDDRTGCRATIDVAILQFALPPRPRPGTDAPPLSTHGVVWASCAEIDQLVREDTCDLVDLFITAYLERHPRP